MHSKMIDIITEDVQQLFRLRAEDLFDLKVDYGLAYLDRHFAHDPATASAMKKHPKFWLWWRELWAERDRKLMTMCEAKTYWVKYLYPIGKEIKLDNGDSFQHKGIETIYWSETWNFYRRYHSPSRIEFYPNMVLINECLGQDKEFSTL